MRGRRVFGLFGLLLAAALAPGQEKLSVGTKPGDVVPSTFRALLVTDTRFPPKNNPPMKAEDRDPRDRTAMMHCLVCENGLNPVVAVFVRGETKGNAPVVRLAQAIDRLIPQYRGDKLAGFVAFLTVDGVAKDFEGVNIATTLKNPDETANTVDVAYGNTEKVVTVTDPKGNKTRTELGFEYPDDERRDALAADVRDLAAEAKAGSVPFGLAPKTSKSTAAWELNENDDVTVVIYFRLRVAKKWTFKGGPTDDQIKEIVAATEEMITGEPAKK